MKEDASRSSLRAICRPRLKSYRVSLVGVRFVMNGFSLRPLSVVCVMAIVCPLASLAQGENWPNWRGPRGDGTSDESNVPTHWDGTTGQGVAWKAELPCTGHSSPIVWEDRVYVTGAVDETKQRVLVCFDRTDSEKHLFAIGG
jgi:hypothetical protein